MGDHAGGSGFEAPAALGSVEVLQVDDPAAEAPPIAEQRGAELVADEAAARAAIAARAAAPIAPVDEEGIAELRRLGEELARAQRVRTRTEESFREVLSQRMAQSSGVAIHPSSIRQAADAILDAERDMAEAEARLAAPPASAGAHGAAPWETGHGLPSMFDERGLEARRARRVGVALAVLAVAVGAGLAALGLVVVGVVVAVVGAAAALLGARRAAEAVESRTPATRPAPEPPPLSELGEPPPEAPLDEVTRRTIELDRGRASERLRAATRHWESLVGADADPHDVEAVLRSRDAQLDLAAASAASPTIRAVSAVHRRSSARWRVAWATLGYDGPPSEARLEAELERLRAGAPRPLLLVEPATWLPGRDLAALLREIPAGTTVTIVERRP